MRRPDAWTGALDAARDRYMLTFEAWKAGEATMAAVRLARRAFDAAAKRAGVTV